MRGAQRLGGIARPLGHPVLLPPQSGTEMEIVSAYPDRELWTNDDARLH
ncbi:MAG: hypothetical protein R3F11_30065 [Verrucomicrobiales bacterium]